MASIENPYNYRRAVLAENAGAAAMGATPNLREITSQFAGAQGKIAAEDKALAADVAFGDKKLAEQNRQFLAKMDTDRQMLDTWAEQNKWATGIAVANLGVQALGIPANRKTLEKTEAAAAEQKGQWQKMYNLQDAAILRAETAAEQLKRQQTEQHEQAMAAIRQQTRQVPIYGQWQNTLPADDNTM